MTIEFIVFHCSATRPSQDIGAVEIREWHTSPSATDPSKPWRDIGYNYVIRRDGRLEIGRREGDSLAHAPGFNKNSIAICLVGGIGENGEPETNFPGLQQITARKCVDFLSVKYPQAKLCGHRDLPGVARDCPCFDVRHWLMTGEMINPRKTG